MSLRPSLVHACFSQSLSEPKPKKCRCKYRVSLEQAKKLVEEGLASWLIVDWKKSADGTITPVTSWNLVWGSKQPDEEPESTVRSALAMKTPRVQTIEKAHMERAYLDKKQVDIDRINEWGRLAQEVISDLTVETPADFVDPFEGKPVFYLIGYDPRTCVGKDIK